MSDSPGGADGGAVAAVERHGDTIVVRLTGELDLYGAEQAREPLLALAAELPERLVLDLAGVALLDSTALGLLLEVRAALARPSALVLAAPGLEARRALEVTGLARHFAVHETLAAALAARPN